MDRRLRRGLGACRSHGFLRGCLGACRAGGYLRGGRELELPALRTLGRKGSGPMFCFVLLSLAAASACPASRAGLTSRAGFTAVSGSNYFRALHSESTRSIPRSVIRKATTSTGDASVHDNGTNMPMVDKDYPGTAVERMLAVRSRVAQLTTEDLSVPWKEVRRKLLWAGGLRDLPHAAPGQGYTGHAFNDYNHVDLTCMAAQVSDNENDGSVVREIALGNRLGPGIRTASLTELGPGGSWSTCANGSNRDPPQDVAHIQFRSRIAFKLVWVPTKDYNTFVLVDDDGKELARGTPSPPLPDLRHRKFNYAMVQGSKYAKAADAIAAHAAAEL